MPSLDISPRIRALELSACQDAVRVVAVCHGNIARSQILATFLQQELQRVGGCSRCCVSSCATISELGVFGDEAQLLADVERELTSHHGSEVPLQRRIWSEAIADELQAAHLILVADHARRAELIERLGKQCERKIFTFYEFVGEGAKDFTDTFDPETKTQDSSRFANAFIELRRIAKTAASIISEQLAMR